MVKSAIVALKERNGSSHQKITKHIFSNFKGLGDEAAAKRHIKMALKTGVSSGALQHTKGVGASGSFKLSKVAKTTPKIKAATKKKPAAKKAAKKPTAKNPKKGSQETSSQEGKGHQSKETKVCQKAKGRQKSCSQKTQGSQEASQQAKTQEVSQKGGQEAKQGWKEEVSLWMADLKIVLPACCEAYTKTAF